MQISHSLHNRQATMTALTAFRSACKSSRLPIMHRGLYSALLLGGYVSCGTVYCNRSCLFVCGWVCGWVCYHDNSKLRASILTKLGL